MKNDRSSSPVIDPSTDERVVLFADMLGFASLTEQCTLDVPTLRKFNRILSATLDDILVAADNPLTKAFSHFHSSLRSTLDLAEMKHPLTAITFSDSAFVATTHLFEAVSIAIDLARRMLSSKVPVRIGIAFGSFAALRFRSDVSADGGNHAAQFLGTSVVRAYQAERCGIKGMRVLLHPSVEPLWVDARHNPAAGKALTCSPAESENAVGVRYEVDYWDFAPTRERDTWHALQDMWDAAPAAEATHYQATANAIQRMRAAHGQEPVTNLRRRTLPRRRA